MVEYQYWILSVLNHCFILVGGFIIIFKNLLIYLRRYTWSGACSRAPVHPAVPVCRHVSVWVRQNQRGITVPIAEACAHSHVVFWWLKWCQKHDSYHLSVWHI